MKKVFSLLLVLCLCSTLAACAPSEQELRSQAEPLIQQDSLEAYGAVSQYIRVQIETVEKDGENQWNVAGTINFTTLDGDSVAVYYTSALRYDKEAKTYSTQTEFGEIYVLN